MKAEQIDAALRQKFVDEERRIVFWDDPNGEFGDYLREGFSAEELDVTVMDLSTTGGLSAKLLLERDDPRGKYLVYRGGAAPESEADWLLDIRLYSAEFAADIISLWREELGLDGLYLREHLKLRTDFLKSKERRAQLKSKVEPNDDEAALDRKMMAVLSKSEVVSLYSILQAICHAHVQDGKFSVVDVPAKLELVAKMQLGSRFWEFVAAEFGYADDKPSFSKLIIRLFVTEFLGQAGGDDVAALANLRLPAAGRQNAAVFLTQWRDSSTRASSFDAASAAVASEIKLKDRLQGLSLEALSGCFTFQATEKRVASLLKQRVMNERQTIDAQSVGELASERQAGHWLGGAGKEGAGRAALRDAYDAIHAAAQLFALDNTHRGRLSYETPEQLLTAYQSELFRFDQLYRHFCVRSRSAKAQNWDLLKDLGQLVEATYDEGYLGPLGLEWGRLLEAGFLAKWSSEALPAQQDFYKEKVARQIFSPKPNSKRKPKRAFVIISDAFRYEAAHELVARLKGTYRFEAELQAMLGVLPSYTTLGMASLLPRETIDYGDKDDVRVDGKSVGNLVARDKQLATVGGMACKSEKLLSMKLDEAREFTKDARVLYIYHDVVDARGDTASTESETFVAVEDCIRELSTLVQFCVNRLSASKVWVTADHGFLFQRTAPEATDKSKLSHKPASAVKTKKRYVIGPELGPQPIAHHGSTKVTASTANDMEFWVPKGTNLFHFAGGARFVHGGAMPQEVVVPLVEVTHVRGKEREATRVEKVSVQVLGTKHKITTPRHRFELMQTVPVTERRLAINLRVAVYDGDEAVTSVETVVFGSTTEKMNDDWKQMVRLELRTGTFDKKRDYRLVLRDADTEVEVLTVPVVIDRSFDDDF